MSGSHAPGSTYPDEEELEILTNPDGTRWVHPDQAQPKFKVGDKVRITGRPHKGKIGILKPHPCGDPSWFQIDGYGYQPHELEKIEDETKASSIRPFEFSAPLFHEMFTDESVDYFRWFDTFIKPTNEPQAQKPTNTMSIIKKLKDLTLSKEDRILREQGFEDENGRLSSVTSEMMHEEIIEERWSTRRIEVAKDLLTLKAEDKK